MSGFLIAMNAGQTRLAIILAYLGLLLMLGFIASRFFSGTKKDYLLASHSIGPFLLLLSMFGTTMTAFALVGSSGESFDKGIGVYGMMASSSGIIHSLCFFLIGVKVYTFGRRYGYTTQIQFFRDRLESDFVGVLLFPILVGLLIPYLLIGVMASGGVIHVMTQGALPGMFEGGGLPTWLGSLIVCLVVLTYVFMGGMRGTAWANAFQTLVFMTLGIVAFVLLANKLGGGETLLESMQKVSAKVSPEKITRLNMSQTVFFSYMFIPLSVAMFPHLFQHWLTAKSAKTFKVPVIMHPIFIMLVWAPCVLIGVWGTTVESSLPPNFNPNNILAFLVNTKIGTVMGGLLAAGILAAIMSSLDSQFLCLGTMFTSDVVTHYAGKDRFSDSAQVWIARMFIILIVALTYGLSLVAESTSISIFNMAVWSFSGFAGLFPIVFASLYWRKLTAAGAVSGILAAFGSWLFLFRESGWGVNKQFTINIPSEVTAIMPVVGVIVCSTLAMLVTSWLTKRPSDETINRFFAPEKSN